jgi:hypothetical protein
MIGADLSGDLRQAVGPGTARGQLESQGKAVDGGRDLAHEGPRLHRDRSVEPLEEELHRGGLRQRIQTVDVFAVDLQRFPARGEHDERRLLAEEHVDQLGSGIQHVLAVVEHQQHPPRRRVPAQGVDRIS